MAKRISVWQDETAAQDAAPWIVSIEDGQASDALAACETEAEAREIAARAAVAHGLEIED